MVVIFNFVAIALYTWAAAFGLLFESVKRSGTSTRATIVISLLAALPFSVILETSNVGAPPEPSAKYWLFEALTLIIAAVAAKLALRSRAMMSLQLLLICAALFLPVWDTNRAANDAFARLPVAEVVETVSPSSGFIPLVAHISDLHVTAPDVTITREGGTPGNKTLPRLLAAIASKHVPYVVASGDITDSGSAAEWKEARRIFHDAPLQILLAPGNHDQRGARATAGLGVPVRRLQPLVIACPPLSRGCRVIRAADDEPRRVASRCSSRSDPGAAARAGKGCE